MAACRAAGVDIGRAAEALSSFGPPAGRGSRQDVPVEGGLIVLIDESYNANPASMRAALETMALYPRDKHPRRIAVLGDMLELGDRAQALHEGLAEAIDGAQIDLIFAAGPMMQHLYDCLPPARQGMWAATSAGLEDALRHRLEPGDVVMIKGSNGSRMAHLVQLVRALGAKAA
jgi:UDP-N-acetylmuramoyl-tripeptide--D-alanyl-D-alanine ligase